MKISYKLNKKLSLITLFFKKNIENQRNFILHFIHINIYNSVRCGLCDID